MNSILGARIRALRELRGLTQEQVAEKLGCTRQKYARIEKGVIDISYASITAIAQIISVGVEEITDSVSQPYIMKTAFRSSGERVQEDKFQYITSMIDTFYAHRKLYNNTRRDDGDE